MEVWQVKKLISALIFSVMLLCVPASALCAPANLPAAVQVSATGIITVTNPPSFTSTTQKGVVFCGYGTPGTTVTIYEFNSDINSYLPVLNGSVTINNSGVFWKKVDFSGGYHKVIVFAENGDKTQAVKREINVLSPNIADKLKSYTVNIKKF